MSKLYQDKDWLYQKYWVEELSLGDMAKLAGVGRETIRANMDKHEIARRERVRAMRDKWEDPEFREKYKQRMEELWKDPEYREAMSAMAREMWQDPKQRERILESRKDQWEPEQREAQRERMRVRWEDSEYREQMLSHLHALQQDPERREMQSNMVREWWGEPEYREQMERMSKELWEDSEYRNMMSVYMKTLWEDSEYREKVLEALPRGEDHPRWQGGVGIDYGPDWREQRCKARERDGYKCQHCGISENKYGQELDVHHLTPFREFHYTPGENENYKEANRLTNLISLCKACHANAEYGNIPVQPTLL